MFIAGIDLAGPANHKDTAITWFQIHNINLEYVGHLCGASDADILNSIQSLPSGGPTVIGIDAPLSYQNGGGYRLGDKALKAVLKEAGHGNIGVMPPTFPKMCFLTLRGISLSRLLLAEVQPSPLIVEVHPGAAMALRDLSPSFIRTCKEGDTESCAALQRHFEKLGLCGIPHLSKDPHLIDACAAALATWKWHMGEAAWLHQAEPPHHPFDFAC